MNKQILAACAATLIVTAPVPEASAFFGTGRIVYDPSNHAQNILTAARTLEQINNQITQLGTKPRKPAEFGRGRTAGLVAEGRYADRGCARHRL